MDPFLGLLGTSVVAAIVGTALKGIIRPLSWAMLAASTLLFGSSKVVDATNALSQNPQLTPSPTATLVADSSLAVPAAAQGWQAIAGSLNPALSPIYSQAGLPNPGAVNPGVGQVNPGQVNPGQVNPGQVNPGQVGSGQVNPGQEQPIAPPPASTPPQAPPSRVSSAQPIVGLW